MYDVAVPGAPMSAARNARRANRFRLAQLYGAPPTQRHRRTALYGGPLPLRAHHPARRPANRRSPRSTHDGKMLVVPDDSVHCVRRRGARAFRRGVTLSPDSSRTSPAMTAAAIYAAISPDDRFAFVAEEQSGKLTVIDMQKAPCRRGDCARRHRLRVPYRQRSDRAHFFGGWSLSLCDRPDRT